MNWLIIILGVILCFLLYQLYLIYVSSPVTSSNIYLGKDKVAAGTITNGNNAKYTVGFWIYINSYTQGINEFIAFGNYDATNTLVSDIGGALPSSTSTTYVRPFSASTGKAQPNNVCTFSMDPQATPTLYANVTTVGSSTATANGSYFIESIPITTNLPIQTWTYVLLSVSTNAGNYADCYLNGKLVVSQKLQYVPANLGGVTALNYKNNFGYSTGPIYDIYLNKVFWLGSPIDPQTAWTYYNEGNGNPKGLGTSSDYGLEVDFTKDGTLWRWTIF